ncbi:MAG: hypothetical protein QW666_02860 [Candidatus Woesearchaeota archaeon]
MNFFRKLFYSAVIGAAVVLSSCKAKEEITLDEKILFPTPINTIEEPELKIAGERQVCIEEIVKEHAVPFIEDTIYFHDSNKSRYNNAMQKYSGIEAETARLWEGLKQRAVQYASVTIIPRELIGKQKKSVLIVFPSAFEKCKSKEDIVSFIVDHEGKHAEDNANGITLCGKKITYELIIQMGPQNYQDILELRAYEHQIKKIQLKQRKVSGECASQILTAYFITYTRVLNTGIKGNKYSITAIQKAKYFPIINLETKEIILLEQEQKTPETPKLQ